MFEFIIWIIIGATFLEVIMFENLDIPKELIPTDPRFGCGPSLIPSEYVQKLLDTGANYLGTSHRQAGVKKVVEQIQKGLTEYFHLPSGYEVVLGNGGASFFWDMMGLGIAEKHSHHFINGEFSSKSYQAIGSIPWVEASKTQVDYGQGFELQDPGNCDLLCTILNETSTGVQTSDLCERREGRLLAVDATSGAGQIYCDLSLVDLYYFSPQKAFASEGGLWVSFLSPQAIERAMKIKEMGRYIPVIMDFQLAIDNASKNQTYNTPSLSSLFYLNEQVKAFNELGQDKVVQLAKDKADHLYNWAESKDYLNCYVQDPKFRSTSVATIDVDDKIDVAALGKKLRELKIVYDIESYRKLGRNQLRIAFFHNISKENLEKLTALLSYCIER